MRGFFFYQVSDMMLGEVKYVHEIYRVSVPKLKSVQNWKN